MKALIFSATAKTDVVSSVKSFDINTETVVIKPNWVSSEDGVFTEANILEFVFNALPQKKLVIEAYTPWRGSKFLREHQQDRDVVTLDHGKKYWDLYKEQDRQFFNLTGIQRILDNYNAEYINVTNEVWAGNTVDANVIKTLVEVKYGKLSWTEFYSYVPRKLYDIRESATLISLSKIKVENNFPVIQISMSIKNIFGLIPHPSRGVPFHEDDHKHIPQVIHDIFAVYDSVFKESLWITEGIHTLVENYCDPEQKIIRNKNLFFIGRDPKQVDIEASTSMGLNPKEIPQLELIAN